MIAYSEYYLEETTQITNNIEIKNRKYNINVI